MVRETHFRKLCTKELQIDFGLIVLLYSAMNINIFFSSYDVIQKQFYFQISMNVNNLEITMATFALNPIQFVSIPLVPTNVSNQNLTFNTVTGFVKFCPKITILSCFLNLGNCIH